MLLRVITVKNVLCVTCFFNHGFKFQDSVCNGCYLTMLCLNLRDIAIILSEILIIIVLFIALANLMQFIC